MYYAEQCVDGIWYYRTTPQGDWNPMSIRFLTERYNESLKENRRLQGLLAEADRLRVAEQALHGGRGM